MKVKQLLYGMMYGLLIFFTVSCSEENSENLPDNVAIYQSYLVAFLIHSLPWPMPVSLQRKTYP